CVWVEAHGDSLAQVAGHHRHPCWRLCDRSTSWPLVRSDPGQAIVDHLHLLPPCPPDRRHHLRRSWTITFKMMSDAAIATCRQPRWGASVLDASVATNSVLILRSTRVRGASTDARAQRSHHSHSSRRALRSLLVIKVDDEG